MSVTTTRVWQTEGYSVVATTSAQRIITAQDLDAAYRLASELDHQGRVDDLRVLLKLIAQAEELRANDSWEEQLTPEDSAALERADAGIAAGKIIPHEVVMQGSAAVEEYLRRRDAGDVPPEAAAAVEVYRQDYEIRRQAPSKA